MRKPRSRRLSETGLVFLSFVCHALRREGGLYQTCSLPKWRAYSSLVMIWVLMP